MPTPNPVVVSGAVEGLVEEAVVRRLVSYTGAVLGPIHGKNGKGDLRRGLQGYNTAAERSPWLVLVDLNHDAECAPPLRILWLPNPATKMCFRVVVREIEAWLLADRERLAGFLGIPVPQVPLNPEAVGDPKQTMVQLAKRSRRRDIREDMVPRPARWRRSGLGWRPMRVTSTPWLSSSRRHSSRSLRGSPAGRL